MSELDRWAYLLSCFILLSTISVAMTLGSVPRLIQCGVYFAFGVAAGAGHMVAEEAN